MTDMIFIGSRHKKEIRAIFPTSSLGATLANGKSQTEKSSMEGEGPAREMGLRDKGGRAFIAKSPGQTQTVNRKARRDNNKQALERPWKI
jgi:hypothetical protein